MNLQVGTPLLSTRFWLAKRHGSIGPNSNPEGMLMTTPEHTLIVGGSSGIGKETARLLIDGGSAVTLLARDEAKLATAASALESSRVSTMSVDLNDRAAVSALLGELAESAFTGLVNAAGVFTPKPFVDHSVDDYDAYHELNRSTFLITQAVAKAMASRGTGSIVNVGSMWARQAVKATPSSAYSMAKAGLHALTQHAAMELADAGVRVNAVAPAVVETPIYESFIDPDEVKTTA